MAQIQFYKIPAWKCILKLKIKLLEYGYCSSVSTVGFEQLFISRTVLLLYAVAQRDLTMWSDKESSNDDLRYKNISMLIWKVNGWKEEIHISFYLSLFFLEDLTEISDTSDNWLSCFFNAYCFTRRRSISAWMSQSYKSF